MFKKLLLPGALLLALLAPLTASAAYVCQTEYYPGSMSRIKLLTTTGANCTGTTTTYWICPSTMSSTSCGSLRYTQTELLSLQSNLVSAADTQQVVLPSVTPCVGAETSYCFYSLAFRP